MEQLLLPFWFLIPSFYTCLYEALSLWSLDKCVVYISSSVWRNFPAIRGFITSKFLIFSIFPPRAYEKNFRNHNRGSGDKHPASEKSNTNRKMWRKLSWPENYDPMKDYNDFYLSYCEWWNAPYDINSPIRTFNQRRQYFHVSCRQSNRIVVHRCHCFQLFQISIVSGLVFAFYLRSVQFDKFEKITSITECELVNCAKSNSVIFDSDFITGWQWTKEKGKKRRRERESAR